MLSALLLSLTLLVSLPDLSLLQQQGSVAAQCPDGRTLTATAYTDQGKMAAVVWKEKGVPIVVENLYNDMFYVYADHKSYTIPEIAEKYPSPCDIPVEGTTS